MEQLDRFIKAQENNYLVALNEIKNGRKQSHWMWYIFPQIKGLGMSETSRYYGIDDEEEAKAYLDNEILGFRLREITSELLKLNIDNPVDIFGTIDAIKLKSSMTLFDYVSDDKIFSQVLNKYYNGEIDEKTILLCEKRKKLVYKK
ncbi:putative uncharacterized protein [Firmicutes bacterium CAG:822]|nr:putative uncharacterized protein [Firmicutes bacterium CAG:822]